MTNKYPKYLDIGMDGVPVRQLSAAHVPEVYRGMGKWEPYIDIERMGNEGSPQTKKEFENLLKEYDADPANR